MNLYIVQLTMAIHNLKTRKLLQDNLDNPDIFNLHLESPSNIIQKIIENDDFESLLRLHESSNNFLSNLGLGYCYEDKAKFFVDTIFSFEILPIKIFTYVLDNLNEDISYYVYSKLIEHKNKFTNFQQQWISQWILDDGINIPEYSNIEISKEASDYLRMDEDMDDFSEWKKFELSMKIKKYEDSIFIENIDNTSTKKLYTIWKICLLEYMSVMYKYFDTI